MSIPSSSLFIKYIPILPFNILNDFFSYYGAKECIPLANGKIYIVKFNNEQESKNAFISLNGLKILDSILQVSYYHPKQKNENCNNEELLLNTTNDKIENKNIKLEYLYPPPNDDILCNILNAIQNVPKLYTQVLHIMNKMNLPPPFRSSNFTPLSINYPHIKHKLEKKKKAAQNELLSSDESELSDEENKSNIQKSRKRLPIINSSVLEPPRKRQKITHTINDNKIKHHQITIDIPSMKENNKQEKIQIEQESYQQWSLEDITTKFPKYNKGEPSCKLYIKNIAKSVTSNILYNLFDKYKKNNKEIIIDLKTKGRMRGQAFITFSDIESSKKALEETNGLIIKGKPIIIV